MTALADAHLRDALTRLAFGHALSRAECAAAFRVLVRGGGTAAQAGALLMGLRARGEHRRVSVVLMLVVLTQLAFTAFHWTFLDAREAEYRLISHRFYH